MAARHKKTKQDKLLVATRAAEGMPQREIARQVGMSPTTVNKLLKDDQVRALIDRAQRVMAAHVLPVTRKFIRHIYSDESKISLDAIKQYQHVMGIAPSHTQSVFVQQLFVQGNSALDPAFLALARRFISEDAIDVTPVSLDSTDNEQDTTS